MAQQPNQGQSPAMLIRPHQIDALPHFTAEQKQHYKNGLTQLWNTLESSPQGSPQHTEAEQKIRQASMKIYQQIQKTTRPGSGSGPQQMTRPQGPQGGNAQGGVAMAQQGSAQGGGPGGQTQVVPQSQGQQGPPLSAQARNEINSVQIQVPPQYVQQGDAAVNNYKAQWFKKAVGLLTRRDQARAKGAQLQQMQRSGQLGNNNVQAAIAEMEKMKSEMQIATNEWERMKAANNSLMGQAGGQGMQRQQSGDGQGQHGVNGGQAQMHQQQQQGGEVNTSPQQPQGAFPQPQPPTSQPAVAPSPVQQQQAQQNMTQQANAAQNYQQQQTAMAQQQAQQQQRQPQRPQMNAQQMAQAQQMQQQQQQQQQNVPNSGVPQSATQQQAPQQTQQQQRPQPLSHQAAVSQAAQTYSREQSAQQAAQQQGSQQNVPQLPNGQMSLNGAPQSATQTTPNSAYPALQQQTHGGNATTKFPIPKQLTLDPRTQMPVPGPASRPTYQTSGMMQQPGIQRPAQFTLEGEGDRVLSKRKLDELVRQVTGTPASDPSSDSHALAPDVEDSVLRSSQTLDIRDVQVVLERNYGIRIPGYSLDEVRTVRKFQPAPGWTSKMQAVHGAKVMGGNNGRDA